jgi:hypothetical protein
MDQEDRIRNAIPQSARMNILSQEMVSCEKSSRRTSVDTSAMMRLSDLATIRSDSLSWTLPDR